MAHNDAFVHSPAYSILSLLISKTAVSTNWAAWCVKVHIGQAQFAYIYMALNCTRFASTPHRNWRDLYLQALFETDRTKATSLIAGAERALLQREHELITIPHDPVEREAVHTAIHALRALKNCMEIDATSLAA